MKKVLLIVVCALVALSSIAFAASTGKISGKVKDQSAGEPIVGANVLVEGTYFGSASDVDGNYFILNVPPGTYTVKCQVIGYKTYIKQNLSVNADLTARCDFPLDVEVIEGETVIVEATRPLIQNDMTSSRNIKTAEEIQTIPVDDIEDIVGMTAGFVDGHARGGRMDEVKYLVNGMPVTDPMGQGDLGSSEVEINIPELSIAEVNVTTGGFSAEYGNAQSGVVDVITKEGGSNYSGQVRYRTSNLGFEPFQDHHELQNVEFSLGGPVPGNLWGSRFFVAGEYTNDMGRFENGTNNEFSISTSLSFRPTKKDKITFNYMGSQADQGEYRHNYSKITYENEDSDNDGLLDRNISLLSSNVHQYANDNGYDWNEFLDQMGGDSTTKRWMLVDLDGDRDYRNEDRNSNREWDISDLNYDGDATDAFNMLDHVREFEQKRNQLQMKWTHNINTKSYLEVQASQFMTYWKYNINETINEDVNMNGVLDVGEDLNGNNKLDKYGTDLFVDENNNDYIDASEIGDDPDEWMKWLDVPFGNAQDGDKYMLYGQGFTYWRLRWNEDEKITRTFKTTYTNQIDNYNKMRAGFEYEWYNIFDHDVDLASGGNVYGQNLGKSDLGGQPGQEAIRPYIFAAFAEDKMEYQGMIVNFGLRFDFFDPNWDNIPSDLENPVENPSTGGEVNDPVSADRKFYWSPRLGIAHPITDQDVMYFNYGRYFQIPSFFKLYRNVNWDFSGAFPMVGNANLEPEITTSFELGLRHQIGMDMRIELKGFQKDIQGLTDMRQVFYTASNYFSYYYNIDYGNVRGFEVDFYKRTGKYFGGSVNYTYSIAKGKSSSSRQNYDITWAGQIIPHHESYLDWDQRHTVNATLKAIVPYVDTHIDWTLTYGSGLPYTPASRTLEVLINTERLPATFTSNLMINKRFKINDHTYASAFIWINNLFDHQNINKVNMDAFGDVQWYHLYTQIQEKYDDGDARYFGAESGDFGKDNIDNDGDGFVDESIKDEYMVLMDTDGDGKIDWDKKNPAGGSLGIPYCYTEGRTIRLGVSIEF